MTYVRRGPAPSLHPERCPYLGLHDDSSTALGYPSPWNYCYRAVPNASIEAAYQAEVCLRSQYLECEVYRSDQWRPLPRRLRGRGAAQPGRSQKTARLILLLLLLALLLLLIFLPIHFSWSPWQILSGGALDANHGNTPAALTPDASARPELAASQAPALLPSSARLTSSPSSNSDRFSTAAPNGKQTTTPGGVCGQRLDVPFGKEILFLIHRVRRGENLSLYAEQYGTSTEAILAVNYDLRMPVWEDRLIVIPVTTRDVAGVPPFTVYQTSGSRSSLRQLAQQLDANAQDFAKYNALDASCSLFSGWLLVPRQPSTSK